jgi:hypothetical protein
MRDKATVLKAAARLGEFNQPYYLITAEQALKEEDASHLPALASAFADVRMNEDSTVVSAITHLLSLPFDESRVEDLSLGLWGSYLILGPEHTDV